MKIDPIVVGIFPDVETRLHLYRDDFFAFFLTQAFPVVPSFRCLEGQPKLIIQFADNY